MKIKEPVVANNFINSHLFAFVMQKTRKILIRKEKREFIKDLDKEVVVKKGRIYFVDDLSKDYHSSEGIFSIKDLKKKDGSLIKTNKKDEFTLISADFMDTYRRIGRLSQMIPLKDIGHILAITGINQESKVVDAGAGSGGLACFLAHLCKEVVTYEINDENFALVKKNIEFLNLENLKVKNKNIFDGIDEKNVDLVTLDIQNPWDALAVVDKSLKIGGYLVSYSPQITQAADFINTLSKHDSFIHIKTVEILEREWSFKGRIVKPKGFAIDHSGFLSFVRKIK